MARIKGSEAVRGALALAVCESGKPLSDISDADLRKADWIETRDLALELAVRGIWLPCDLVDGVDHFHPEDLVESWAELDAEPRAFTKTLADIPARSIHE